MSYDFLVNGGKDSNSIEISVIPKWISVEDRLPEPETKVLTFCAYNHPYMETDYFGIHMGLGSKDGDPPIFTENNSYVTHWMPLPEAPK